MAKGKKNRYAMTTFTRRLLNRHSASMVTAIASAPAIESTLTNVPMLTSPSASERMMPAENPSAPTHSALRQ